MLMNLKFKGLKPVKAVINWVNRYLVVHLIQCLPSLAAWNSRHPVVMGVYLLNLAAQAIEKDGASRLSRKLYTRLPQCWKHPEGPATEEECIHLIRLSVRLVKALRALTVR